MNEESLFIEALEIRDPSERAAFLDRSCATDPALRARLERLLAQHERAGDFLERPVAARSESPGAAPVADTVPRPVVAADLEVPTGWHKPPTFEDGPGSVIGPYKLLQQLGEGGMGVVFMAEQTHPVQRKVALKLIRTGMDSKAVLARFEAERQALALMDHPNIAKVLDAGTTNGGAPYFVMELIKGVPVTKYCDDHQLTCSQRLELFVSVCHAVQHAHQKGIIHRDIKPSNVLVCLYDGKPVPKVIDFGVAKATGAKLTDRTLFTAVGSVVGTLEYMSPEQAEVNQLDVDTRSDIYSLGVLFYELLTGTTPLDRKRCSGSSFLELLRLIREEEPQRPSTRLSTTKELPAIAARRGLEPRRLSLTVRGELDWIALKALEKERARRYETANGFAADVLRYLRDEQVHACPPSAGYRFRKFARRNKAALATATAAVLVVLAAVAGLATSNFLISNEQLATKQALANETRAKNDLKETLDRERVEAYYRRIALAHRELSVNNLGRALGHLEACPEDLRGWDWHYLMRLCRVEPVVIRDKTAVNGIAFSPGGERIASAGGNGAITIWNSNTGASVQVIGDAHRGMVCSIAFHAHGNHLASVGSDELVKVWDLTTGQKVFERPCDSVHQFGTAYGVAFSPLNPNQLAVGSDGIVTIWDWTIGTPVHKFPVHGTLRISVAFSRDGRTLATGGWQGNVKLWDAVAGGGPVFAFAETPHTRHPVAALAFGPDGTRLASASFDRRADVWDTTTGHNVLELPHSGLVLGVAFTPDGKLIATVGEDKVVRLWDVPTGRELLELSGHTAVCGCVTFSPDGRRLASASVDRTIRIWDATPLRGHERQEAATFTKHHGEIWSLAIHRVGQKIVSAGFDQPALLWDAKTQQPIAEFSEHKDITFCVAWHPDGERVVSAGGVGGKFTVKVWDTKSGREAYSLPTPPGPEFFCAAFSPDGRHLVTCRANGLLQVWDANNGQPVRTLGTDLGVIRGVAFSPDGQRLVSVRTDGEVYLWDATRLGENEKPQTPLRSFGGHVPGPCLNVAFSPNGEQLVMCDKGNALKVCAVETGEVLSTLRGFIGDVHAVAFSPDGRWIAFGGEDSTVKIWDRAADKVLRTFRGHKGLVTSLAFTPDGKFLVSGSRDRTVKFWDVAQLEGGPPR
jgi:WD40 repeat protein